MPTTDHDGRSFPQPCGIARALAHGSARGLASGAPARLLIAALIALLHAAATASTAADAKTVDFTRPDLSGEPFRLSAHRGRWVVVNFWATWCPPCIRELPLLQALHDERDDVTVVGVNFEVIGHEPLKRFVDDLRITFPVVQAGSRPLLPFEPLKGLPSTFVVSPEGALWAAKAGEIDAAWLAANTVAG